MLQILSFFSLDFTNFLLNPQKIHVCQKKLHVWCIFITFVADKQHNNKIHHEHTTCKFSRFFYITDEFCKEFDKTTHSSALSQDTTKAKRNKPSKLSHSEVITILMLFHSF